MLSTTPEWLSLISRRKLQSAGASGVGSRDNRSLRRFVLLKNSIVRADVSITEAEAEQEGEEEEIEEVLVVDTPHATEHCATATADLDDEEMFVFPDASSLDKAAGDSAEAAWFNALLEVLEDDSVVPTPPPHSYDDPDLVDEDEDDYLSSLFFSETQEQPSLEVPSCPPPLSIPIAPYHIPESALPLPQSEDGDSPTPSLDEYSSDAESDCPPTPSFGRSTTSLSSLPTLSWDERELRAGHSPPDDAARVFVQELTYFDYHDSPYPYAAC